MTSIFEFQCLGDDGSDNEDGDYDDGGNDGCDNDDDGYDGDDLDLSLCDPVSGELDNGKIATTNRCLDLVEPNPAKCLYLYLRFCACICICVFVLVFVFCFCVCICITADGWLDLIETNSAKCITLTQLDLIRPKPF